MALPGQDTTLNSTRNTASSKLTSVIDSQYPCSSMDVEVRSDVSFVEEEKVVGMMYHAMLGIPY